MGAHGEVFTPVEVLQVTRACAECGEDMTCDSGFSNSAGTWWFHSCPNGHEDRFERAYPYILHRPKPAAL